jgi:hypothetical protein
MKDPTTQEVLLSVIALIIPVAAIAAGVAITWFRTQERLRLIEKGVPLAELPPMFPSRRRPSPEEITTNFRVVGIVCTGVGLGLLVLFTALAETLPAFPKGVIAVSAVPLFIGLGFLIEYRIRRSDGGAGRR